MMSDNYNFKVIDFGEAKNINEAPDDDGIGGSIDMRRGTFVGTLNYQSPEVIKDDEQGLPLDTWAAGAILYKMLTGKPPFPGTNMNKVHKDI